MNARDPSINPLETALRKQAQGRGTNNTEKRLLSDLERGRIGRDHFSQIYSAPERSRAKDIETAEQTRSVRATSPHTQIGTGKDKIYGSGDDGLAARVAVLEALLSGLSRQTVSYCTGGVTSSKTILMS
jgi:hypothetical protein